MLIVQKYGGTSVGSPERIKEVAKRVARCKNEGNDVAVIVSAMSGVTDSLIAKAYEISQTPSNHDMDILLSSGEIVSASLTAMAIETFGFKSIAFTGSQAGIITDNCHTKAKITKVDTKRVAKAISEGYVPVIAGFQGVTDDLIDITTLGRGGSDLSAVAVAEALKADLCEIYTDVDGVYTTDPNIVKDARKLEKISYEEMLELASLGAKVLQSRSVEFAKNYNVKVVVRSSFTDDPGTLIVKEDSIMEQVVVSGVAYDKKQARITIHGVPDRPGIAALLFTAIANENIVVDMIVQNISIEGTITDISFTVPKTDISKAMEVSKKIAKELKAAEVLLNEDIAKISVVGVGMRTHSGVAAKIFKILSENNINIMMISTSEIKVSCIVDLKYTELAVRVLHDAFELNKI
ncbi:MAG: aspartate kinase [Nitrospirae bacterium]|nr:aspartate kinase [Nitrospirota bacterium]